MPISHYCGVLATSCGDRNGLSSRGWRRGRRALLSERTCRTPDTTLPPPRPIGVGVPGRACRGGPAECHVGRYPRWGLVNVIIPGTLVSANTGWYSESVHSETSPGTLWMPHAFGAKLSALSIRCWKQASPAAGRLDPDLGQGRAGRERDGLIRGSDPYGAPAAAGKANTTGRQNAFIEDHACQQHDGFSSGTRSETSIQQLSVTRGRHLLFIFSMASASAFPKRTNVLPLPR